MDISQTVSGYITKMVSAGDSTQASGAARMKILLLDAETVAIVSSATTQSALLNHNVYLTDRLDNQEREKMRHLRCIAFLRPSPDSIQFLIDELREPNNIIKKSSLERLAEADDHEVVKAIMEYFADYLIVNPDLCSLPLPTRMFSSSADLWNQDALSRATEGVLALLLSLKKKPLIRYEKNSLLCKKLATEVRYNMTQEEQVFDFRKPDTPPILLLVDRRDDPITPLLTQWTYQAMVHELLGIENGRVNLSDVPEVRPEFKEIVISQDQDPFFAKNMYLNFGDLGQNAKDYVEQFASKQASGQKLDSIEDMKRFVEEYPEFRRLSGNVTKHVTLVTELSRRVGTDNLLDVSELEQSLACNDNHSQDVKTLQRLIQNPAVPPDNKLRLVAIYALRYANHASNSTPALMDLLGVAGNISRHRINLISKLMTYAHSLQLQTSQSGLPDLFQPSGIFDSARQRLNRGLRGVENVYTQHSPRLETTLQDLIKGRLSTNAYPFIEGGGQTRDKPQDIVVVMVGGATYEEAKMVAQVNASSPGVRVVLCGTGVLNSRKFLDEVEEAVDAWPEPREGTAAGRLRKEVGRTKRLSALSIRARETASEGGLSTAIVAMPSKIASALLDFDIDAHLNPYIPHNRLDRLPRSLSRWLGYRHEESKDPHALIQWISTFFGVFLGLLTVGAVYNYAPAISQHNPPIIIASLGATAALDYSAIRTPLAQPRNAIFGHAICAIMGVSISKLFQLSPDFEHIQWVAGALSCAIATVMMAITNTIHPPGGATAVMAATQPNVIAMGWWFVPVLMVGYTLMMGVALLVNNVARQYPVYWWTPQEVGGKLKREKGEKDGEGEERMGSDASSERTLGHTVPEMQVYTHGADEIVLTTQRIQLPAHLKLTADELALIENLRTRIEAHD
nr:hypothetical protein B0A51_12638 [Rachicladosporium sp. CCFEE 5018]